MGDTKTWQSNILIEVLYHCLIIYIHIIYIELTMINRHNEFEFFC